MRLRFFTIPIHGGDDTTEDLNRFLAGHRVVAVDRQLVHDGQNSVWAVCVAYEMAGDSRPGSGIERGKRGKVDYREVLSEADFTVYAQLRSLRKQLAEQDGVPAYALFTNEQMAEMVQRRVSSLTALREIAGVGEARAEKYGEAFLAILRATLHPPTESPATDHET